MQLRCGWKVCQRKGQAVYYLQESVLQYYLFVKVNSQNGRTVLCFERSCLMARFEMVRGTTLPEAFERELGARVGCAQPVQIGCMGLAKSLVGNRGDG
jgi:hypothetical protein